jgi:hypothetical protein
MMTRDPYRLMAIIKDRHILVETIQAALKEAKNDNAGDCFKLNRELIKHQKQLSELEAQFMVLVKEKQELDEQTYKRNQEAKKLAAVRLRLQVSYGSDL